MIILRGKKNHAKMVKPAQCSSVPFSLLFFCPVDMKISPLFPFSQILKQVQDLSDITNSLHCHASPWIWVGKGKRAYCWVWNTKLLFLLSFQDSQLLIASESNRDCLGKKESNPKKRCHRNSLHQATLWAVLGTVCILPCSFILCIHYG